MSYNDVSQMASCGPLQNRVTACAATENEQFPPSWMAANIWLVVAAPGWGLAWASALAGGMTPDQAGADEGVITDGMILSSVQAVQAGPQPKEVPEP